MTDGASSTYVCVITGASRGIGRATAEALTCGGATVVTLGRDAERNDVRCDLSSFASIRHAAGEIRARWSHVNLLINNAGVHHATRQLSSDGIERTLAVNYLGPFLLTRLLLPHLRAAGNARVLTVSSALARWGKIHFDDLQLARDYGGTRAYLQSKLANIMFALSLAEELEGSRVTSVCVYPGLVATDLLRERWWWRAPWLRPLWRAIFLSPNGAARAVLRAAKAAGGVCFSARGRPIMPPRQARDAVSRRRLWEISEQLISPSERA